MMACKEWGYRVKGYDAFVVVVRFSAEGPGPPGMWGEGLSLH